MRYLSDLASAANALFAALKVFYLRDHKFFNTLRNFLSATIT